MIQSLIIDLSRALSQLVTGRLLTDEQIKSISQNTVGKYFADWLPMPKDEAEARNRVEKARLYIGEASQIITGLQTDLNSQARQLDQIIIEIEAKKKQAEHYKTLAETNKNAFAAFKIEMEETLRNEIVAQANKGKRSRQFVSFIFWLVTLILGAALGTYFISIINFFQGKSG